jgi:Protein of unknown function (DUF2652)
VKFVAHLGEVAIQRVKRISKLAGLNVILVHRMLKNTVPLPEYMLLSEPLFHLSDEKIRTHTQSLPQDFEGLGPMQTYFIDICLVEPEGSNESSLYHKQKTPHSRGVFVCGGEGGIVAVSP